MSNVNSSAVFIGRARELDVTQDIIEALVAGKVDTHAKLAYLTNYQPGGPDDSDLLDKISEISSRPLEDHEKAAIRQLFYESSAITVNDIKQRIERVDNSEPVAIPMAERMARMVEQRNRLVGVHFSIFTEPSNRLVDSYFQMLNDKQIVWVPWDKLGSKADEIQNNKKSTQIVFDSSGNLKMTKRDEEAMCELKGELQIRQALTRRSLAVDMCSLISYHIVEGWHEKMFESLTRTQVSGYRAPSMEQIRSADRMLWTKLGNETRGDLALRADGTKPAEEVFRRLINDAEINLLMLPTLIPSSAGSSSDRVERSRNNDRRGGPYSAMPQKKFDNIPKRKPRPNKIPDLPEGCSAKTPEGKPLCFNFNRGTCRRAQPGKRCDRGWHLCWKTNCHKAKSFTECTHDR